MNPSVKKINNICKRIEKLTEEDFKAVEELINEQSSYINPLKNARANKFHKLADHNQRVLDKLRELQTAIKTLKQS